MTQRQTYGFSVLGPRCTAVTAGGLALFQLGCTPVPHARAPAGEVPTVLAPSAGAAEPDVLPLAVAAAGNTSPTRFEAAQRIARSLFGRAIGPEFDADDPTSLAPEGYSAKVGRSLDLDADGLEDIVLTLNPDPDGSPGKSGPCVLVLALAVDASKYVVAAINGEAFACRQPAAEDGMDGTEVMFTTSDDGRELVINVAQQGHVIWETWSFQVGYDAKSSRFVLSKLFNIYFNRTGMLGGNTTLYPLEGRGERVEDGVEPEPLRASPTRVFFEDLSNEVAYKLLGS